MVGSSQASRRAAWPGSWMGERGAALFPAWLPPGGLLLVNNAADPYSPRPGLSQGPTRQALTGKEPLPA